MSDGGCYTGPGGQKLHGSGREVASPRDTGLDIGRRRKAKRIADAIRSLGGTVADARKLTDAEWTLADALSRAKPCEVCKATGLVSGDWCTVCKGSRKIAPVPDHTPSDVTRALAIEYLSRPESPRVEYPEPRDEDVPA